MLSGPWQALAEQLAVLPRHIKVWRRTWTEEEWNERMASVLTELVGEVLDGGFPRAEPLVPPAKRAARHPPQVRAARVRECMVFGLGQGLEPFKAFARGPLSGARGLRRLTRGRRGGRLRLERRPGDEHPSGAGRGQHAE